MSETVAEVLARLLENARQLNRRSAPEPDTADEDETDAPRASTDTSAPEKNG